MSAYDNDLRVRPDDDGGFVVEIPSKITASGVLAGTVRPAEGGGFVASVEELGGGMWTITVLETVEDALYLLLGEPQ